MERVCRLPKVGMLKWNRFEESRIRTCHTISTAPIRPTSTWLTMPSSFLLGRKSRQVVLCLAGCAAVVGAGPWDERLPLARPVWTTPKRHLIQTTSNNPTRRNHSVLHWLGQCPDSFHTPTAPINRMELTVVKNATCTFCGCVCDDIELHTDGNRIHQAKKACVLGKAWFLNHTGRPQVSRRDRRRQRNIGRRSHRGGRRLPVQRRHAAGVRHEQYDL